MRGFAVGLLVAMALKASELPGDEYAVSWRPSKYGDMQGVERRGNMRSSALTVQAVRASTSLPESLRIACDEA